jgi:hypothetical protein
MAFVPSHCLRGRWAVLPALALAAALPAGPVAAQTVAAPASDGCAPEGGLKFLCGIKSPEDVAVIPGTNWVVTGSFTTDGTGGLYAIDSDHPALTRIYPSPQADAKPDLAAYPDCAGPPDPKTFSALGLSIRPRAGGGATAYVVGGGQRHGIEVFALSTGAGTPKATWVGCVHAPPGAELNGVAGMFTGEMLTTAIFEAPMTFKDVMAGKVTGNVYARVPGKGFEKMPGTALSGDNGIDVTRDHKWMFVAATGTRQVLRYERTDMTRPPSVIALNFGPDNIRGGNGRLLVAGNERPANCATGTPCPSIANVTAIDPQTLATTVIARFPATEHWSGLSGAAIVGNTIWLASHRGDRIAYRSLQP